MDLDLKLEWSWNEWNEWAGLTDRLADWYCHTFTIVRAVEWSRSGCVFGEK